MGETWTHGVALRYSRSNLSSSTATRNVLREIAELGRLQQIKPQFLHCNQIRRRDPGGPLVGYSRSNLSPSTATPVQRIRSRQTGHATADQTSVLPLQRREGRIGRALYHATADQTSVLPLQLGLLVSTGRSVFCYSRSNLSSSTATWKLGQQVDVSRSATADQTSVPPLQQTRSRSANQALLRLGWRVIHLFHAATEVPAEIHSSIFQ